VNIVVRRGTRQERVRLNAWIRAREVRLIDKDGKQVGIVKIEEALRRAREDFLDLVEIVPDSKPPVCRIIDYNKYKYEQKRRAKEARKKQKDVQQKEIRLSPVISDHDYNFKKNHIENFLKDGNRVKVTIKFKGRQIIHPEKGRQVLEKLTQDLSSVGTVEGNSRWQGKWLQVFFKPI